MMMIHPTRLSLFSPERRLSLLTSISLLRWLEDRSLAAVPSASLSCSLRPLSRFPPLLPSLAVSLSRFHHGPFHEVRRRRDKKKEEKYENLAATRPLTDPISEDGVECEYQEREI